MPVGPTTAVTTTTADKFIGEVWATGVLTAVEFAAVLQKRVTREYEGEIKRGGDTVHVPRLSNLTTQTKTGGTDINFEAITETEQTLTISTMEYAAFKLESIVQVQSNYDLLSKYQRKIGYALARGREVTLAALIGGLTQTVGALGVELSSDDYNAAWLFMAQAGLLESSTDPGDDFTFMISPAAYAALLKTELFINRDYNPNNNGAAVDRAMVAQVYGAPVMMTNLLTSPGANQHNNALIHRSCFALAVQNEVPVRAMYIIQSLADAVVGYNIYGTTTLSYPPETPGGGAAVANRGVWLKSV